VFTDRTRDKEHKEHKLKHMKFNLNTRKHFFILQVVKHRNKLHKEIE